MVVVTPDKMTCPDHCDVYISQVIRIKHFFLFYMINKPKGIKYGSFPFPLEATLPSAL